MQVSMVILKHCDLFWLHQRRADKSIYPGLWGIGIGGKAEAGEDPRKCAQRELAEESGIVCSMQDLQGLGDFSWQSEQIHYHGHVFYLELASPTIPQACVREFTQTQWMNRVDIEQLIPALCPDTAYFWKLFSPLIPSKSPFSSKP